jgi:hypothetical protein
MTKELVMTEESPNGQGANESKDFETPGQFFKRAYEEMREKDPLWLPHAAGNIFRTTLRWTVTASTAYTVKQLLREHVPEQDKLYRKAMVWVGTIYIAKVASDMTRLYLDRRFAKMWPVPRRNNTASSGEEDAEKPASQQDG